MSVHIVNMPSGESRPAWADPIAQLLAAVDERMLALCASDVMAASDISIPVFSAGGKRIRPALVILSALAAGGSISERLLDLAAATEFMHTASLIHDDVVDETTERRGIPTTKFEWGSKLSVLGGDFLLAKAFLLVSWVGDPAILNVLSSTAVKMSESEILQATCEGRLDAWEENYWRIISDKTAAFMGACCECGALLAGEDDAVRDALRRYGTQLGLAFQITDDLLDITGDPVETGKDVGSDLVHGKFTLPVLLALKNIDEQQRRDILSVVLQRADIARQCEGNSRLGCGVRSSKDGA